MADVLDLHVNLSEQVPMNEILVPGLDPKIAHIVHVLRAGGVETYESCQGGEGHSYPEPTVRFFGQYDEGFRAYAWAKQHGLPVCDLRRCWIDQGGELVGPHWEMTFFLKPEPEDKG